MAFALGNGIWGSVFAVPSEICDSHLRLAGGLSVKALLLILRHEGRLELRELAAMLGQAPSDVQDAVNYWVEQGILRPLPGADDRPEAAAAPREEIKSPPKSKAEPQPGPRQEVQGQRVETLSAHRPRLTTGEINELAAGDRNVTYLLQETQAVLGKPLSPVASSTVASLYSYSGMAPELILMLAQYCTSIGKSSMRYIERVADDWLDRGIDSYEKAEAEILRLTERNQLEGRVMRAFGIRDRSLVTKEKEYIRLWQEEYKLDFPLVELAYERAVEQTGKMSFAYINAILKSWYEKGVRTPAEALRELRQGGKKPAEKAGAQSSSYDMSELEKMIDGSDV